MTKKHQGAIPSAPASFPANVSDESAIIPPEGPRRKRKLIRSVVCVVLFIVFHSLILVALGTIIPIIKPKYRIRSVTIENLSINNDKISPSFSMKLSTVVTLKNMNFGSYKFQDSNLTFSYNGALVGEAAIYKSSVKLFSTKKMRIILDLSSDTASRNLDLAMDIASGTLLISGTSRLRGQVEYMKVIKRNKSVTMNCSITINSVEKAVQELRCD